VANFQPVITALRREMRLSFANSWINCMKLVVCSTVPDILPFFKAESGSTMLVISCW